MAQSTYFEQDFESSTLISDYITGSSNFNIQEANKVTIMGNQGTPNAGQSTIVDITSNPDNNMNHSNQLRLVRAQGATPRGGFFKNDLPFITGLILVSFDFDNQLPPTTGSGNYATGMPSTWLQLGDGFTNDLNQEPTNESSTTVYAELGIANQGAASNPKWGIYANGKLEGDVFSGSGKIKWVINNTSGNVTYKSPIDNNAIVLEPDHYDIWVTNDNKTVQLVTNSAVLNSANASGGIKDFKDIYVSGNSTQYQDNIKISTLKTDGSASLPVSFASPLSANVSGGAILLSWKTATEFNNRLFNIYRSTDAINFKNIGQVNAVNRPNIYTFTDFAPEKGINYYRLEQIDNDGNIFVSKTVNAKFNGSEQKDNFSITRIASNSITIKVLSSTTQNALVLVYNLSGKLIASMKKELQIGANIIDFPIVGSSGIYFLKVNKGARHYTQKFLKP